MPFEQYPRRFTRSLQSAGLDKWAEAKAALAERKWPEARALYDLARQFFVESSAYQAAHYRRECEIAIAWLDARIGKEQPKPPLASTSPEPDPDWGTAAKSMAEAEEELRKAGGGGR